jgi:dolichol-phosphate mannosyltransferase
MAHVSLIVLRADAASADDPRIDAWCEALEVAGHTVAVVSPGRDAGLTAQAIDGLRESDGEIRVVIDTARQYAAADLPRLVEPLSEGRADVAVADGRLAGWRALAAFALRPISGSADPFSGLIALTAAAFERAEGDFKPVGRRFAFEILARANRNRTDVVVEAPRSVRFPVLGLDDLRHIKRIADDRLGNVSRLLQFCVVGASGMVVDLSFYALFQWLFGLTPLAGRKMAMGAPLDLAVSGILSIAIALTWNFTLNRYLTFSYAKGGSVVRQFVTYVLSNALGIAVSLTLRLTLPEHFAFFAKHRLAAAVVGIVAATGISFSMARWLVFRPRTTSAEELVASEEMIAEAESAVPEVA